MAMPKNTTTKDYVLCGLSLTGSLMSAYAAYAGIGASPVTPASWYIMFTVVSFGLYGLGFFAAPAVLIDMNFNASYDKYHLFLGRFTGYVMLVFAYVIYFVLDEANAFKFGAILSAGCGILGPTYAGLYLEPKQNPMGHLEAHILFFVGGTLGVLATM